MKYQVNGNGRAAAIPEATRRLFLHTPADVAQSYTTWAEQLKEQPGIRYGCVLDKVLIPLHPGDMMAAIARPGHGKSSWMAYMAKQAALDIARRGAEDEVVAYATWEQPVEEIDAFFQSGGRYSSTDLAWGRVPMDTVRSNAVKRASLPVWSIGHSMRHTHIKKPPMTLDIVFEAVEAMRHEFGKRVVLLCMDYLQIIPTVRGVPRHEQVAEAAYQTKQLLMAIGAPGLVGVQARREVDGQRDPIPAMGDGQHSSAIEQVADKAVAIWRPAKSHDPAVTPVVKIAGREYANNEELLVLRILKQRFDVGYGTYAVRFKPQTLEVFDYDVRQP